MDTERCCAIAIDLPGCGGSDAVPLDASNFLAVEVETVEAVIAEETVEPVQLVGHSYGAVIVLSLALAGRVPVRSLILFEPLPYSFLEETGDSETLKEIAVFVSDYRRAYEQGDRWAVRRVIDLWGGAGTFEAMPPQVRELMASGTEQNICQWEANRRFRPSLADYRSLRVPTTLVFGEETHRISSVISRRLHKLISTSKLVEMPAAGHFMIQTHAAECARYIGPTERSSGPALQTR